MSNQGIRAAFKRELSVSVVIPPNYKVMGAIDAALLARNQHRKTGADTKFSGFPNLNYRLTPTAFECAGCGNLREVIKVEQNQKIIAVWGGKCGKHSNHISA